MKFPEILQKHKSFKDNNDKETPRRDADMVYRLRIKFVSTAMTSLLIILILIIAVINVANFMQIDSSADEMLEILLENGGSFPDDTKQNNKEPASNESPATSTQAEDPSLDDPVSQSQRVEETMSSKSADTSQDTSAEITEEESTADQEEDSSSSQSEATSSSTSSKTNTEGQNNTSSPTGGTPPQNGEEFGSKKSPPSFPQMDFQETRRIEAPFETRYFSVSLNADGEIISTNIEHIAAVTEDIAAQYALAAFYKGRTNGYASAYRYASTMKEDGSYLVVFVDCSSDFSSARMLILASIAVGVVALLLMFALVWLLSGRAVAPVVESLDKQKRFISDAGHELKTPITVISANVDVLEMTGTKNEWTASIRSQTRRMTDLVNNMLTLSRLEEESVQIIFSDVDFSRVVRENAASFEAVAQASGLEYSMAIQDGIHINGEAKSLQQICTVLLDNAMKYSSENGSVYIALKREYKDSRKAKGSLAVLEVSNTCDQIPDGNLDRLFDRFYRVDSSRTKNTLRPVRKAGSFEQEEKKVHSFKENSAGRRTSSGGFGIGLSVAKAVVSKHDGSIKAVRDGDHLIRFQVILPARPEGSETKHLPKEKK